MSSPSGATPFVGRQRELARLLERLDTARQGQGGVALVVGEPGIGKTRLLVELSRRARAAGWQVLAGRAYETEGMPPYLPFAEALRDYLRDAPLDELLEQLGDRAAEVALITPEVRRRLPDLPASQSLSPEQERYRLFEGVADFLLALAQFAERPGLLLVLDDLQWADRPTLLLLQHLARRLANVPLAGGRRLSHN